MKFKNIKAFSHNLTHSYVSFENCVDGELVFKELKDLAYKADGEKISIFWIYSKDQVLPNFSERITKSIESYKEWLPKLLDQHDLKTSMIHELRTDIFLAQNRQIEVQSYARDMNGKEYTKNIYEFADYQPYKPNKNKV